MMENLIYTRLNTDSTLTNIVGNRIYPAIPEEAPAYPFVVYYRSGTNPNIHLAGVSSISENQFTIDIVGLTETSALAVASEVQARLHGWSNRPSVQGCFLIEQSQEPQNSDQFYYYLVVQTYRVIG